VLTELTRSATGLLKVLVVLTSFTAQTPLEGADTAIWLAAGPEVEGMTAGFWNKWRQIACRYRDPDRISRLYRLVERQRAHAAPLST
jgi:hypothetical protein